MPNNKAIMGFNSGELSPKIDTRFDVNKYERGCRILKNLIATKYGGAERRGGTKIIGTAYDDAAVARLLGFIYSAAVAYKIEMTPGKFRFYYEDDLLLKTDLTESIISTPYYSNDLYRLQTHQIGDVMWIAVASRPPKKLKRIDPYTFTLTNVPYENGPFELRNDLVNLNITNSSEMSCSARYRGQYGTLRCTNNFFESGHQYALFQLTHPRETTMITQNGSGTSASLAGQGTFTIVTRGRWSGTVYVQRQEGSTGWANFRSYRASNDRNVIESWTEEEANISFRINSGAGGLQSEISINSGSDSGIVKVLGVGSSRSCSVKVIKSLQSTGGTKRWAEGSWSNVRGWPSAVGFFEERCVFAGATTGSEGDTTVVKDYPNLYNLR